MAFSEILRIKPIIDPATAVTMEANLNRRFTTVTRKFSNGLKTLLKGGIAGIAFGVLDKILNPLSALEEKLKRLTDQGDELRDMAEKFDTNPGRLKQFSVVAQSLNIKPDELKGFMEKFLEKFEKAQEELQDKTKLNQASDSSIILSDLVKDGLKPFDAFTTFLVRLRNAGGADLFFGDTAKNAELERRANGTKLTPEQRAALIKSDQLKEVSPAQNRINIQKEIFGDRLFGGLRQLVEPGFKFGEVVQGLGTAGDAGKLGAAAEKAKTVSDFQARLQAMNQANDFIDGAAQISNEMAAAVERENKKNADRDNRDFKNFESLKSVASSMSEMKDVLSVFYTSFIAFIKPTLSVVSWIAGWFGRKLVIPDIDAITRAKGKR